MKSKGVTIVIWRFIVFMANMSWTFSIISFVKEKVLVYVWSASIRSDVTRSRVFKPRTLLSLGPKFRDWKILACRERYAENCSWPQLVFCFVQLRYFQKNSQALVTCSILLLTIKYTPTQIQINITTHTPSDIPQYQASHACLVISLSHHLVLCFSESQVKNRRAFTPLSRAQRNWSTRSFLLEISRNQNNSYFIDPTKYPRFQIIMVIWA